MAYNGFSRSQEVAEENLELFKNIYLQSRSKAKMKSNSVSHSHFLLSFQNLLTRAVAIAGRRRWELLIAPEGNSCAGRRESKLLEESAKVIDLSAPEKELYLAEIAGRSRNTLVTATERARIFNASSPTSKAMPGIAR